MKGIPKKKSRARSCEKMALNRLKEKMTLSSNPWGRSCCQLVGNSLVVLIRFPFHCETLMTFRVIDCILMLSYKNMSSFSIHMSLFIQNRRTSIWSFLSHQASFMSVTRQYAFFTNFCPPIFSAWWRYYVYDNVILILSDVRFTESSSPVLLTSSQ